VVTIGREIGSGGAYIGQQIATRLGILCLDREILQQVARQRGVPEELLTPREEAVTPVWRSVMETFSSWSVPESGFTLPPLDIPSDEDLFALQSAIITRVAREQSAVVIGRCGSWVLRHHPRHVSVFCHASTAFRLARLQAQYNDSPAEAAKLIEASDRARAHYRKAMTGVDATDARQYDLCVNTGLLGVEGSAELILEYVQRRMSAR
jgi:cytidylate kinase